jgi:hypothetical protein
MSGAFAAAAIRLLVPMSLPAMLVLSACATPARMHTEAQLNDIGARCGLALGELIQDDSEKRLLLVLRSDPSPAQRTCVAQWGREKHLKTVFVHMDFPNS